MTFSAHPSLGRGLAAVAACLAGFAGCGEAPEPPPTIPVSLAVSAELRGSALRIDGTTDLPDGALISYEVRHENWRTAGEAIWLRQGLVEVQGGAFGETIRLRNWPPGDIEVRAAFQTVMADAEQPPEVVERYGPLGEKLGGPNVRTIGDIRIVETSVNLTREGA